MAKVRKLIFRLIILALVFVNILAFWQAHRFTRYADEGSLTGNAEKLSSFQKLKVVLLGVKVPRPEIKSTPSDFAMTNLVDVAIEVAPNRFLKGWFVEAPGSNGIVMLFHNYARAKDSLLKEAKEFHGMGYSVMLMDFRGSGESYGSATTMGYHEADDVALSFKYVKSNYPNQKIILYGDAMGAVASLRAVYYDRVQPDALILAAPFDRFLNTTSNRFRRMGIPPFPSAFFLVTYSGILNGYVGFQFDPVKFASSVECPVLLMRGEDDANVLHDEFLSMREALRINTPKGKMLAHEFEGQNQASLLAGDPETWTRLVKELLAFVEPPELPVGTSALTAP